MPRHKSSRFITVREIVNETGLARMHVYKLIHSGQIVGCGWIGASTRRGSPRNGSRFQGENWLINLVLPAPQGDAKTGDTP